MPRTTHNKTLKELKDVPVPQATPDVTAKKQNTPILPTIENQPSTATAPTSEKQQAKTSAPNEQNTAIYTLTLGYPIRNADREKGLIKKDRIRAKITEAYLNQRSTQKVDEEIMNEVTIFDSAHVDSFLRTSISEDVNLNKSIGVNVPFQLETIERAAMDAVLEEMEKNEVYKHLFLKYPPLPEQSTLTGEARTNWENEYEARDMILVGRNDLAKNILSENQVNSNFLELYLDATLSSPQILGNPAHPKMTFQECTQIVFPIFKRNPHHFTVVVVQFKKEKEQNIADIKYYDSFNNDMEENLKAKMIDFFKNKGYVITYDNCSEKDQYEGHNCAVFAALGAIDIVNMNRNSEHKGYLDNIASLSVAENYARIAALRLMMIKKLQQTGIQIKLSPSYENATKTKESKSIENTSSSRIDDAISNLVNISSSAFSLPIEKAMLYACLTALTFFITIPYIHYYFLAFCKLLPSNPLTSILMGAMCFTGIWWGVNKNNLIKQDKLTVEPLIIDLTKDGDQSNDQPNSNPTFTPLREASQRPISPGNPISQPAAPTSTVEKPKL